MLALYWYASDHPVSDTFDRQFHAALKRQSAAGEIEYYAEYFESARFPGESQARVMRDYLREKYSDRRIDVLLAWGGVPLQFLLANRNDLFPGTPIVYYVGTLEAVKDFAERTITGVLNPDAYQRTLDLALTLHPDTRDVFIVSGTPSRDKLVEREVSAQVGQYAGQIALTYLTDLPLDQLIATVKNLPNRSVILYARQSLEAPDTILVPSDILELVSRAAPVPVYCPWQSLAGYGSVGGLVEDREAGAAKAAEMAVRIARGARPEDVPAERVPKIPMFDARQLARWSISEASLPAGSIVLHRQPTIWSQYGWYIVATGLLLGLQTVLIGTLLVQRGRRRSAEAAWRMSEQRYALATRAGSVGVWDWNLTTRNIWIDPTLKRALGYEDGEIDNRLDSWLGHVHPEDGRQLLQDAYAHVNDATPSFENEHRMLHRDGSVRWFLTRGSAVRLPDGSATRIIGTDTDITQRKQAEMTLEESRHELARVSRASALTQCAAVAHEASQPLNAILLNARACLRWLASPSPSVEELRATLRDIADAATQAHEVVSRNRSMVSRHSGEKQLVDLNDLVRDVAALARPRLHKGRVDLEIVLEPDLPDVFGDRIELQQVVLNLVLNGVEAIETANPQMRRVSIRTSHPSHTHVQVAVRDTGVGLRSVDATKLFTAFYTTKPSGTGIGLSISRFIVEGHGGRLWAEGDGPGGATFTFTVPVADVTSGAPAVPLDDRQTIH